MGSSCLRTACVLLQPHSCSRSSKSNRRMSVELTRSRGDSATTALMMEELRLRNNQGRRRHQHVGMDKRETSAGEQQQQQQQEMMYLLLIEEVADRIEMHTNIGKQRENWNSLLLNSINMMTLTATILTSGAGAGAGAGAAVSASTLLFGAATGFLIIMNKIQPSQLAEEQRNAVRLFKELETEIESKLGSLGHGPTIKPQVAEDLMKKVLALDRAYPLPLLGKMLQKFPNKLEPAVWWPNSSSSSNKTEEEEEDQPRPRPRSPLRHFPSVEARYNYAEQLQQTDDDIKCNGWTEELEVEMRAIAHVLKTKDEADYLRLGNIALNTNKVLAISGPLLTGFTTAASALQAASGSSTVGATTLAALAGALAVAVNTLEHGGQVGMVVEMYRNCAGFFRMMEESIQSTLEERDLEKRENGVLFERKVALKLGRSLSQLRDLARKSIYSDILPTHEVDEFGSKLF